jgi:lysophospholipase L1-like esterase
MRRPPARLAILLFAATLASALWFGRAQAEAAKGGGESPGPRPEPACKSVAHIGDSLTAYTRDALAQAYGAVGVDAEIDAFGGRATLQKLAADPKTGKQAALALHEAGFRGCWVVALGTNDTANIDAGACYTRAKAIDEMMTAIDPGASAPVLWVNTFTLRRAGHWSNANMKEWNRALLEAQGRWQNLRVFDWASVAATGIAPFSDGIHHTASGYAERNRAIAEAIAALR